MFIIYVTERIIFHRYLVYITIMEIYLYYGIKFV